MKINQIDIIREDPSLRKLFISATSRSMQGLGVWFKSEFKNDLKLDKKLLIHKKNI